MNTNIILKSNILKDNYTEYITEKFDLQVEEEIITNVPMINQKELETFEWNIGLICGNSGSGKSTILKHLGNIIEPQYDYNKCIISQFPYLSEKEVCDLLCSVGLSSVPIWLHKPHELSNGEKARLDMCWYLANAKENTVIMIDEYSSVVNRQAAKSMSYALQRYVREKNIKVLLSSCHFDIIEWLNPDWVFNLNKQNNGICEIERFIYSDDKEYKLYQNVNEKDILTQKKEIKK